MSLPIYLRFVVTAIGGGQDVDLRKYATDGIILTGRLKKADQQEVEFHDDLEKTLTEGERPSRNDDVLRLDLAPRCIQGHGTATVGLTQGNRLGAASHRCPTS